MRSSRSRGIGLLGLALLLVVAMSAALAVGPANLSLPEIWMALQPAASESPARAILLWVRLPRIVAAALSGAGLAVSGVLFQALLRNPLAEPYLLGVSSGAALGAVAVLSLGLTVGPAGVALAALAGALIAIATVFRVAYAAGQLDTRVLILAGVVVASFFGAGVMLVLTLAEGRTARSALLWTMGSFGQASWQMNVALAAYSVPAALAAFGLSRHLNALALDEESAAHLGTDVERVKKISYLLASLLAAAAVSVAGVIGFVGLVVPHAIRLLWGVDHRYLIPMSFLAGGSLLVLADAAARTVAQPLEIPVGVVTALIGVPLFLVLLRRGYARKPL
ncbi:MAG: iron ABC transporter permease [Gemmatimonadota bacterium]